jgi:hypothetical protein
MNSNCNTDSQPVYFILHAFIFSFVVDGTSLNCVMCTTFAVNYSSSYSHFMKNAYCNVCSFSCEEQIVYCAVINMILDLILSTTLIISIMIQTWWIFIQFIENQRPLHVSNTVAVTLQP